MDEGRAMVGRTEATRAVVEAELLRHLLIGLTIKEASGMMRASYQQCRKIARTPEFLVRVREHSSEIAQRLTEELANSTMDFAKKLEAASEKALDEMMEMMDGIEGASQLKMRICQDLLDRDARASRTKKLDVHAAHDFISPAVLLHAAATAKEIDQYQQKKLLEAPPSDDDTQHPSNS
jgi:hypothetical protein